jgi:hypothetical protein
MTNETALTTAPAADIAEQVAVVGDLAQLSPAQRMAYYGRVCESLGINPYTQPFQYIRLNNKLVLYATRTAADQLRKRNAVSLDAPRIEFADGLCIVTVTGTDETGRTDTEIGAVPLGNLQGEARANAIMKAVTKAKRRLTLSICGLGWLDETEVESIRDARPVNVTADGEIVDPPPATLIASNGRAVVAVVEPPMPDDELVVKEAAPGAFFQTVASLLDDDEPGIKARMKALGYKAIPGASAERLAAYRKLRDSRVETAAAQDELFGEEPVATEGHWEDPA